MSSNKCNIACYKGDSDALLFFFFFFFLLFF